MFRGLVIFAVLVLGTAVGCSQNDGTTATSVPSPVAPPFVGAATTNDPGVPPPTAVESAAANDPDPASAQTQARQVPQRGRGFVPLDDPTFLAADGTDFFGDEELVLGVEFAGEFRAYPVRMLRYHHIVNDTVAGEPLLVTY